jgi:hypothetical protein
VPKAARMAATASSVAFTPSATRAGSPGSTVMNANTTTDATTRLTTNTAVRTTSWRTTATRGRGP